MVPLSSLDFNLDPRCRSRSFIHFLLSIFCQRLQNGNPSHSIQATSRESAGEAAVGGPETPESRTSPKMPKTVPEKRLQVFVTRLREISGEGSRGRKTHGYYICTCLHSFAVVCSYLCNPLQESAIICNRLRACAIIRIRLQLCRAAAQILRFGGPKRRDRLRKTL